MVEMNKKSLEDCINLISEFIGIFYTRVTTVTLTSTNL
jgi:hypothetical protein